MELCRGFYTESGMAGGIALGSGSDVTITSTNNVRIWKKRGGITYRHIRGPPLIIWGSHGAKRKKNHSEGRQKRKKNIQIDVEVSPPTFRTCTYPRDLLLVDGEVYSISVHWCDQVMSTT